MTYDPKKAKALFEKHVKPVVCFGGRYFDSVFVSDERASHYAVTAEVLGALGWHAANYSWNQPAAPFYSVNRALYEHLNSLLGQVSFPYVSLDVAPDPKPAWRIAADEALDNGLDFPAVLDAIEKALEAK